MICDDCGSIQDYRILTHRSEVEAGLCEDCFEKLAEQWAVAKRVMERSAPLLRALAKK